MNFNLWMEDIDNAISAITEGMTHSDFTDIAYHDLFKSGCDPQEVLEALADEDAIFAQFLDLASPEE